MYSQDKVLKFKSMSWISTLSLLIFGVYSKGFLGGIIFYAVCIALAYALTLIVMGIVGGAFSDISKMLRSERTRAYSIEYASPFVALIVALLTSWLFHHLHFNRPLFVAFMLYMMAHFLLLFIDRKITGMKYLWSSLLATEAVFMYAILFLV